MSCLKKESLSRKGVITPGKLPITVIIAWHSGPIFLQEKRRGQSSLAEAEVKARVAEGAYFSFPFSAVKAVSPQKRKRRKNRPQITLHLITLKTMIFILAGSFLGLSRCLYNFTLLQSDCIQFSISLWGLNMVIFSWVCSILRRTLPNAYLSCH